MTTVEMARQLGAAIQQDERYVKFMEISQRTDLDPELQRQIGEFNRLRMELGREMRDPNKNAEKMTALDDEIKELYDAIMANPMMIAYNEAKADLDDLLASVNFIITAAANGQDPMTCPDHAPEGGCADSCASCSGCH
ncbi:MAG: YlbF family regulator [Ruminococcus sp.]|nr:YlbF family regulator [Ruminococcus sp.]